MSAAAFTNKLNRRHKAALCSMLICVGLILLIGGAVRLAVGVGLLGIAFSWALGSNKRLVHWLFVICGLLLLVPAVGDGFLWPRQKPELIKGLISLVESERVVINDTSSLITTRSALGIGSTKQEEELSKQSYELAGHQVELERMQAEGIFRHVMKNDWGNVAGGLLLLSAGLGLIIGVNPVHQDQPEAPR